MKRSHRPAEIQSDPNRSLSIPSAFPSPAQKAKRIKGAGG